MCQMSFTEVINLLYNLCDPTTQSVKNAESHGFVRTMELHRGCLNISGNTKIGTNETIAWRIVQTELDSDIHSVLGNV